MGMLDSNTDRSFFMIGAIAVAGVVIALLIAVVSGSFADGLDSAIKGLFDNAESIINGNAP